jgi:deoxyribose-phosphate aldolase
LLIEKRGYYMDYTCRDIAKMIDHSLLKPELNDDDIIEGCEIAKKYDTASVTCSPAALPLVKKLLAGSNVKPTTVIGFPHGYSKTEIKVLETEQAIEDGAEELDMVINIGKLRGRDFEYVKSDIKAVVDTAHKKNVILKVIFENYYLSDELKAIGYKLAEEAGADYIKTSTGFAGGGATIEDLKLMRKTVSNRVQIKAAGGVRDLDAALKVREVGGTRFGATRTQTIMEECYKRRGKNRS